MILQSDFRAIFSHREQMDMLTRMVATLPQRYRISVHLSDRAMSLGNIHYADAMSSNIQQSPEVPHILDTVNVHKAYEAFKM